MGVSARSGRCIRLAIEYNRGYTPDMKTAISVPDELYNAAELAASRLGVSRSMLYQQAMVLFLECHGDSLVTDALDEVYGEQDQSALDPMLDRMQRASLARESW